MIGGQLYTALGFNFFFIFSVIFSCVSSLKKNAKLSWFFLAFFVIGAIIRTLLEVEWSPLCETFLSVYLI